MKAKRIMSLVLALALCLTLALPVWASGEAEELTEIENSVNFAEPTDEISEEAEIEEYAAGPMAEPAEDGEVAESSDGKIQLGTPRDLHWDEKGNMVLTFGEPFQNVLELVWYRVSESGDECINGVECHLSASYSDSGFTSDSFIYSVDTINREGKQTFLENGDYYFTAQAVGDGVEYESSDIVKSPIFHYERPDALLPACTDLSMDEKYVLTFTLPESDLGGGYRVTLWYAETENDTPELIDYIQRHGWYEPGQQQVSVRNWFDWIFQEYGIGYYSLRVRAMSSDITQVMHGPWSELSEPYYVEYLPQSVAQTLDALLEETDAEAIRAAVQALDRDELRMTMLVNDDAAETIAALEERCGELDIQVADGLAETFKGDVSIIGARLNDIADEGEPVVFRVEKPQREDVIPELYNSAVAVRFAMSLDNIEDQEALKVPVRVTLPVPQNVNPDFLVVLHYPADGGAPEEVWPYLTQEGGVWYATFMLDSFSDFVLTEMRVMDEYDAALILQALVGLRDNDADYSPADAAAILKQIGG